MAKNLCGKTRSVDNPYEVWKSRDGWTWNVLKKWQVHDDAPYARWFCFVTSPFCPDGEYGDVYVKEITDNAEIFAVEGVVAVHHALSSYERLRLYGDPL
jgi:hypothetical protein